MADERAGALHARDDQRRSAKRASTPAAFWTLAALSFGYGVFHAAGPGHGKAVMASYMVANERALSRGLVLTAAAAVLQAVVAIVFGCGLLVVALGATAARMTDAAQAIEIASYAAVGVLWARWLVWRKGRAFASQPRSLSRSPRRPLPLRAPAPSRFACDPVEPGHAPRCRPAAICTALIRRRSATASPGARRSAPIAAAGARPCSGAILVLVFALAQGLFAVGIAASLFMALGTALTTGALAMTAVFAKRMALRFVSADSGRAMLVARGAELCAALVVLLVGVALLLGNTAARMLA